MYEGVHTEREPGTLGKIFCFILVKYCVFFVYCYMLFGIGIEPEPTALDKVTVG